MISRNKLCEFSPAARSIGRLESLRLGPYTLPPPAQSRTIPDADNSDAAGFSYHTYDNDVLTADPVCRVKIVTTHGGEPCDAYAVDENERRISLSDIRTPYRWGEVIGLDVGDSDDERSINILTDRWEATDGRVLILPSELHVDLVGDHPSWPRGLKCTAVPGGSVAEQPPNRLVLRFLRDWACVILQEPGDEAANYVARLTRDLLRHHGQAHVLQCPPGTDARTYLERVELEALLAAIRHAPEVAPPEAEVDLAGGDQVITWLVDGWLPEQAITLFAAAGGAGKSTTAATLAQAIAQGVPWLGFRVPEPRRVLIVDAEQSERLIKRLYRRTGGPHKSNLRIHRVSGLHLAQEEGVKRLVALLEYYWPSLVILDSVAQIFGVELNDNSACSQVYGTLQDLRNRFHCAFLLLAHKRKSPAGGFAAGTRLEAVLGAQCHTSQPDGVWFGSSAQARPAGAYCGKVPFRRPTEPGHPVQRRGARRPDYLTPLGPVEKDRQAEERERAEGLIETCFERSTSAEICRKDAMTAGEALGFSRATIDRALRDLCKAGQIERVSRGKYRKPGEAPGLFSREKKNLPETGLLGSKA